MVDLIEEDFTSRAFDNIKALNSLAKEIVSEFDLAQPPVSEEDFVVTHLDHFFKFRNKIGELEQLA